MEIDNHLDASLVKGMRDLTPETLLGRTQMIQTIRQVYERFGFEPLETPVVELRETLLGSAAGENAARIFAWHFEEDLVNLGLRFDLTVPLARHVAMNKDGPRPFKRHQIGPVFRVDKPAPGRFREFLQFDIDTIGTDSLLADAEIVAAIHAAFQALGVQGFQLLWNHRKLLNAVLAWAGFTPEQEVPVIRVIDKCDKIGLHGVEQELGPGRVDQESGSPVPGLKLPAGPIGKVLQFLGLQAPRLDDLAALLAGTPGADVAIHEAREFASHLLRFGLPEREVVLDPRLARGMDYYTGPIFEVRLTEAPDFGSVAGGGRYDNLVARFSPTPLPGTGASIGVDRLLAALLHLGRIPRRKGVTQVLMTVIDRTLLDQCVAITRDLRAAGYNTELYLDPSHKLKKQLAYADVWGASVALMLGSNEAQKSEITVKDLRVGAAAAGGTKERDAYLKQRAGQVTIAQSALLGHLATLLS